MYGRYSGRLQDCTLEENRWALQGPYDIVETKNEQYQRSKAEMQLFMDKANEIVSKKNSSLTKLKSANKKLVKLEKALNAYNMMVEEMTSEGDDLALILKKETYR